MTQCITSSGRVSGDMSIQRFTSRAAFVKTQQWVSAMDHWLLCLKKAIPSKSHMFTAFSCLFVFRSVSFLGQTQITGGDPIAHVGFWDGQFSDKPNETCQLRKRSQLPSLQTWLVESGLRKTSLAAPQSLRLPPPCILRCGLHHAPTPCQKSSVGRSGWSRRRWLNSEANWPISQKL